MYDVYCSSGINDSVKDFPLCVNDRYVSLNDIPMTKLEGDTKKKNRLITPLK